MFPKYMNFTVEGVKLADQMFNCDDTQCRVKLEQLRPQTSGVYRCEISGDAPHFSLIHGTANMTVAGEFYLCRLESLNFYMCLLYAVLEYETLSTNFFHTYLSIFFVFCLVAFFSFFFFCYLDFTVNLQLFPNSLIHSMLSYVT